MIPKDRSSKSLLEIAFDHVDSHQFTREEIDRKVAFYRGNYPNECSEHIARQMQQDVESSSRTVRSLPGKNTKLERSIALTKAALQAAIVSNSWKQRAYEVLFHLLHIIFYMYLRALINMINRLCFIHLERSAFVVLSKQLEKCACLSDVICLHAYLMSSAWKSI